MRIMLTGGSACGKSTFGEDLACRLPMPRYYIAAMEPYGEENQRRIARHRAMRKEKGFETIECYTDTAHLQLPVKGGTVLLECLCNLTANEIFSPNGVGEKKALEAIMEGLENLDRQCSTLIIITNDVGSGDDRDISDISRSYIEILGQVNRRCAQYCHKVAELVCGIPIMLKGEQL